MHKSSKKLKKQNGYIGIVILLVMVVILGIGISLARRSSKDVEISTQQESAARVFNSAELGADEALSAILQAELDEDLGSLSTGTSRIIVDNNSEMKYSISKETEMEIQVEEGASAEILLNSGNSGTIDIKWSKIPCSTDTPALLVSVFSADVSGEIQAKHYAYNINGCSNSNNFVDATGTIAGTDYYGAIDLPIQNNDLFVRVKPIYNDADIFVAQSSLIDTSQYKVISQAQNQSTDAETKAIEIKRTIATAPWFMDYALVSGADIVKQ